VGTVLPFAEDLTQAIESQLVGEGYIPCDGRALAKSDTEYQALYQVIGGSYSEDYTSFFVPDYRGRFLRGTDLGAGRDPDAGVRTSPNPGATKPETRETRWGRFNRPRSQDTPTATPAITTTRGVLPGGVRPMLLEDWPVDDDLVIGLERPGATVAPTTSTSRTRRTNPANRPPEPESTADIPANRLRW
jgi:hypothetical protein